MPDKTQVELLREEFDAKYKAFEDAHRDQVKAALRTFATSVREHPVCHLVSAGIGAAALKFGPVIVKWFS